MSRIELLLNSCQNEYITSGYVIQSFSMNVPNQGSSTAPTFTPPPVEQQQHPAEKLQPSGPTQVQSLPPQPQSPPPIPPVTQASPEEESTTPPPKKPITIEIVAIWIFLAGLVSGFTMLTFLGLPFILIFTSGIADSSFAMIVIASSIIGFLTFLFITLTLFKTRTSLRKMEYDGFRASLLYFFASIAFSLISLIFGIFDLSIVDLIPAITALFLHGIFLILLLSARSSFVNNGSRKLTLQMVVLLVLLFLAQVINVVISSCAIDIPILNDIGGCDHGSVSDVVIFGPASDTDSEESTEETAETDALTEGWTTYTSEEYGFYIEYPEEWNMKEYPQEEFLPITIFMFSPNSLPPYSPYFSEDPEAILLWIHYLDEDHPRNDSYLEAVEFHNALMEALEENTYQDYYDEEHDLVYQSTLLGGLIGVNYTSEDLMAVLHNDRLYQLWLPTTDDDTYKTSAYTDVAQRISLLFELID